MKNKYIIILLIIGIIASPLHAQFLSHETYNYTSLHVMAKDNTTKKEQPPSKSKNDKNKYQKDDSLDDDSMDHDDIETYEDLEDIPDDFYDYQEENL